MEEDFFVHLTLLETLPAAQTTPHDDLQRIQVSDVGAVPNPSFLRECASGASLTTDFPGTVPLGCFATVLPQGRNTHLHGAKPSLDRSSGRLR